jgi:hypothetical protein
MQQFYVFIIIICDIYIARYSGRSCSKALYKIIYNIIIPDSAAVFPLRIQRVLPLKAQSVTHT